MQTLCPDGFSNEQTVAAILAGALQGLAYMHKNSKLFFILYYLLLFFIIH